jgi:hypothetical protein
VQRELRRSLDDSVHHLLFAEVNEVTIGPDPVFLKEGNGFVVGKPDANPRQQFHAGCMDLLNISA